jgi:voltage-gated potassium channel
VRVLRNPALLAAQGGRSQAEVVLRDRMNRLLAAAVMVFAVVGGSSVGYWLMHGGQYSALDCLYMSVITVSTVGYGEVVPVDTPSLRVLTIFLIVTGTGSLVYFGGTLAGLFVEGDLRRYVEERNVKASVDALHDHVIVCGGGATGREAAISLERDGIPVLVIERNEAMIERIRREGGENIHIIADDALDDVVLRHAGVERARAVIAALSDDPDNLYALVAARALHPHIPVVCRAHTEAAAQKMRAAGATHVVSPNALGGGRIALEIAHPALTSFFDLVASQRSGSMRIDVVTVGERSKVANLTLAEAGLRAKAPDTLVVALKLTDGSTTFVPGADQRLPPGVSLVVFGRAEQIEKLRAAVG